MWGSMVGERRVAAATRTLGSFTVGTTSRSLVGGKGGREGQKKKRKKKKKKKRNRDGQ